MNRGPDFEAMDDLLEEAGAPLGAAESHGVLCGLLSLPHPPGMDDWLRHVLGELGVDSRPERTCLSSLESLYKETVERLESEDLSFQPLLPPDVASLSERTRALGQWCQGFLFGLGAGGLREEGIGSAEAREALDDLQEISRVDFDANVHGDQDENAYAEIVEYVRIAVLTVRDTLRASTAAGKDQYAGPLH